DEMQRLSLSGGRFAVDLKPQEPAASGSEQVEFLVAGHAGVAPRPLSKVASGGELSRISLAIRVVTAQRGDVPSMIFDEVDVGIGGGVAEVVGQLLKTLGQQRQVLVITHLPQVAAQGSQHLQVSKFLSEGQTLSRIKQLDATQRIDEIARMLGGVEITETTRQHASEMLTHGA
ncbi:MAG: DNA repair protein RecN, partial [Methylobacillus glycogenes]|nr:DNA repair protein RecN [Methylobacillus glycogenes]